MPIGRLSGRTSIYIDCDPQGGRNMVDFAPWHEISGVLRQMERVAVTGREATFVG